MIPSLYFCSVYCVIAYIYACKIPDLSFLLKIMIGSSFLNYLIEIRRFDFLDFNHVFLAFSKQLNFLILKMNLLKLKMAYQFKI